MRKILFILVAAYFCSAFACNSGSSGGGTGNNPCATKPAPWNCSQSVNVPFTGSPSVNDHTIKTPGGVKIHSVVDIPLVAQLALDQAAQADIVTYGSIFPQWTAYKTMPEFQVFVIEPDHFSAPDGNDPGAGLLNVWYTTSLNKGVPTRDTVSSAGTCIGCPGSGYQIYPSATIPHQANVDPAHPDQKPWSHLRLFREAAFNEWQHAIECANDQGGVCMQFAIAGDVHPHFGEDIWSTDLPTVPAAAKRVSKKK